MTTGNSIFRCVRCSGPHPGEGVCAACGHEYETVSGVPLLVRDMAGIEAQIEAARAAGRSQWYDVEQPEEFVGVWRHALRKRRAYLDGVLAKFMAERNGAPVVALDMGCGDGAHLKWLAGYSKQVYGSDYNLLRLERASARVAARGTSERIFMADVTDYPARDDSFDLIFFNHVLEHIPDDRRALAEVRRILKPGGLLMLGVPNEGAWFWRLSYKLEPKVKQMSDHVQFYTGKSLRARCEEAGLKVSHVEHIGWGVPHKTLDFIVRRFKIVDDTLELVGRRMFHNQATSLYLLCSKG